MAQPLPPEIDQNEKVMCKLPGTGTPKKRSRSECSSLGGVVVVDDDDDTCFVRDIVSRALSDLLLEVGGTYNVATTFRDDILAPTSIGASLLNGYYQHINSFLGVVKKDSELLVETIDAWRAIFPFASAVATVGAQQYSKVSKANSFDMIYDKNANERFQKVLRRYLSATDDGDFKYYITELSKEIDSYVDLNPEEALKRLGRKR